MRSDSNESRLMYEMKDNSFLEMRRFNFNNEVRIEQKMTIVGRKDISS